MSDGGREIFYSIINDNNETWFIERESMRCKMLYSKADKQKLNMEWNKNDN